MKPLVSVLCCTYNHEKYIGKALQSFVMQKADFPFEVIVHDDASSDDTPKIIREYQEKYPDIIKPVLQNENQYSKGTKIFDILLEKAQGEYIALCEGDDFFTSEHKLQRQIDCFKKHTDCVFCTHASSLVNTKGEIIGEIVPYRKDIVVPPADVLGGGGSFFATSSYMYKKIHRVTMPEFFQKIPQVGDFAVQMYLITCGKTYYLAEKMSAYRKGDPQSWSEREKNSQPLVQAKRLETVQSIYKDYDKYTDGAYHSEVEKALLEREFKIILLKKDYKKLKSQPYKAYYKGIRGKRKLILRLNIYTPRLYRAYKKFKYKR